MNYLAYISKDLSVKEVSVLINDKHTPIKAEIYSFLNEYCKNQGIRDYMRKNNHYGTLRFVTVPKSIATTKEEFDAWLFTLSMHNGSFIPLAFVSVEDAEITRIKRDIAKEYHKNSDKIVKETLKKAQEIFERKLKKYKNGNTVPEGLADNYIGWGHPLRELGPFISSIHTKCLKDAATKVYSTLKISYQLY